MLVFLAHLTYSFLVSAFGGLILCDLLRLWRGQRGRLPMSPVFVFGFLGVYLLGGGQPGHLGAYLANTLSVITAYGDSQANWRYPLWPALAICTAFFPGFAALIAWERRRESTSAIRQISVFLLAGFAVWFVLKAAYTRADIHIVQF